jgi:hypothetical protein
MSDLVVINAIMAFPNQLNILKPKIPGDPILVNPIS